MTHLFLGLAIAIGAPGAKDAKKDPPSVVGEWSPQSAIQGGKPDPAPPGTTLTFTADGKCLINLPKEKSDEMTYKSDPKKDPPQIDLIGGRGMKDKTALAIYKIEGDTLTICLSEGGDRPTKFESPAGSKNMLLVLKRVKKD